MLDQGQLIEIEEAAMRGKTFSSDVVLALMEIITELEKNATAQALALKAAKAMQQAETERADKLQDYVLSLEHDQKVGVAAVNSLTAKLDVASKRADANERDAERYRWLKHEYVKSNIFIVHRETSRDFIMCGSRADFVIDQAMSNV